MRTDTREKFLRLIPSADVSAFVVDDGSDPDVPIPYRLSDDEDDSPIPYRLSDDEDDSPVRRSTGPGSPTRRRPVRGGRSV